MMVKIDFKKLKFIFIDFDGTLVDTVPLLYDNYLKFLKKYGIEGTLEEFQSLLGPTISEFVPLLKERYGLSEDTQKLLHVYTEDLAERYNKESKLIRGSIEFLEHARKVGLNLALVTSSPLFLIEGALDILNIKPYFSVIVTGEQVQKTKPDPEIYLLTLKLCHVKPEEALAIEDSYNGILSAQNAHIPTVALKNKHLTRMPKQVFLVSSWTELLTKFKSNTGECKCE